MKTRIAVQHGDRFIRSGLGVVLAREPDLEVVGDAAAPAELVALCAETRPDAVLIELNVDQWDAAKLATALRKRQRTLRCIGMYSELTAEMARRAFQGGIHSSVAYSTGTEGIIAVLRGNDTGRPVVTLDERRASSRDVVTPREIEILRLIAAGMITREIAESVDITVKTVENHKQRIFRKLDVQNQAHAVSIAIRRGLISPAEIAKHA